MATILIADTDTAAMNELEGNVRDLGHSVELASDGAAVWNVLTQQRVDLVLMDAQMPGMDGLAWLRRIRTQQPEAAVVLTSGRPTVPQAVEAMLLGAFEYLVKPVSSEDLRLLINHVSGVRNPRGGAIAGPVSTPREPSGTASGIPLPLKEVERRCIAQAIEQSTTLGEAAQRLGIDPATLWRKRKRYGL